MMPRCAYFPNQLETGLLTLPATPDRDPNALPARPCPKPLPTWTTAPCSKTSSQ